MQCLQRSGNGFVSHRKVPDHGKSGPDMMLHIEAAQGEKSMKISIAETGSR
jgi:hypothetical protein